MLLSSLPTPAQVSENLRKRSAVPSALCAGLWLVTFPHEQATATSERHQQAQHGCVLVMAMAWNPVSHPNFLSLVIYTCAPEELLLDLNIACTFVARPCGLLLLYLVTDNRIICHYISCDVLLACRVLEVVKMARRLQTRGQNTTSAPVVLSVHPHQTQQPVWSKLKL
jgi:hypothetical protein